MVADAFQIPVLLLTEPDAAAVGAALQVMGDVGVWERGDFRTLKDFILEIEQSSATILSKSVSPVRPFVHSCTELVGVVSLVIRA